MDIYYNQKNLTKIRKKSMAADKRPQEALDPPKRAMKGKQAQITLTLPPELLARVNQKAERLSISRAAFMKMAITRAVEAEAP